MKKFKSTIISTWKPSGWLRSIGIFLLVSSAFTVFAWQPALPWLMVASWVVYVITFLFALSLSFVKPKILGAIHISEDAVKVFFDNSENRYSISNLQEIGLNHSGYGNFWERTIQNQKNHLYFTTQAGEEFDHEIILDNIEKEAELKQFLNSLKTETAIKFENS